MPSAVETGALPIYQVVGHGVDSLVLNICYADGRDKPVKQELAADAALSRGALAATGQAGVQQPAGTRDRVLGGRIAV